MIGHTRGEQLAAITAGGPGTGFGLALAELSMYWDLHENGRPEPANEPVLNIRITGGTEHECTEQVRAIAAWLGTEAVLRNGTWMTMRRFGPAGHSLMVEAHYTPDHDLAFAQRLAALVPAGRAA